LSDIFRAYNYAADSKSVKIPDVDFDLPKVTIEEQEELPPEEAFMEFTPESFSSVEEQIIEPEEEQEKLVYPTREELAEFYRDELNAIALEVEIKAYSDALQSKKAELQNSIDSILQKINEMEELQKNYLQDYDVVNDLFVKSIEKTCFKGAGKRAKGSIIDRLKLELNEGSEPEQVKISEINYGIMVSYLSEDEINVFLKTVDNTATKALNDLKSKLERLQNSGNSEVSQKDFNNVQQVVNMVGTFMQYISSNVLKAHRVFTNILIQTLMDFHSTYC
jgi:hypothetical protein